jgi:hypothetical protein
MQYLRGVLGELEVVPAAIAAELHGCPDED